MPGRGFVPAGSLKPDDEVSRAPSNEPAASSSLVRLIAGQSTPPEVLRVKTLTFENQPFLAYNFEIGEDHTFFVGVGRAWVHNGKCGKNARDLRKNMEDAGVEFRSGEAAGHIVPSTGKKGRWAIGADSRKVLNRNGVKINEAANGVPIGHPNPHGTMHTEDFLRGVNSRLHQIEDRMLSAGYNRKQIGDALRKELTSIGRKLPR